MRTDLNKLLMLLLIASLTTLAAGYSAELDCSETDTLVVLNAKNPHRFEFWCYNPSFGRKQKRWLEICFEKTIKVENFRFVEGKNFKVRDGASDPFGPERVFYEKRGRILPHYVYLLKPPRSIKSKILGYSLFNINSSSSTSNEQYKEEQKLGARLLQIKIILDGEWSSLMGSAINTGE